MEEEKIIAASNTFFFHYFVGKHHLFKTKKVSFSDHKLGPLAASGIKNFPFPFMPVVYLQHFSGPESQKDPFHLLVGKKGKGGLV